MIVPTAFAVRALTQAFETVHEDEYLQAARSACDSFEGLKSTFDSDESFVLVTTLSTTLKFKASLFAAEHGYSGGHTGEQNLDLQFVRRVVLRRQRQDGHGLMDPGMPRLG